MERIDILGITVHSGSIPNMVSYFDARLRSRSTSRVAFLNAHLSNVCAQHPALAQQLRDFIILNDGVGMDIARWFLHGAPFQQNLNGTDFTTTYLDQTSHDLRLFLLGAKPDVVAAAAKRIAARWPRHEVVGFHHGFLDLADQDELNGTISKLQPDMVLVGMGNPLQEQWLAANIPALAPFGVAVGAWFDFLTNTVSRAPLGWQRTRLEWVYRLSLEPKRLMGRYLIGNPLFLARLVAHRLGHVAQRKSTDA